MQDAAGFISSGQYPHFTRSPPFKFILKTNLSEPLPTPTTWFFPTEKNPNEKVKKNRLPLPPREYSEVRQ